MPIFLVLGVIMELVRLFSAKVLEPVYFSLFLIYGKNLKNKRLLFTFIMIFEYIMLKEFIKFNVWYQFIYTFMTFVNLKVFYKEKAQITDIFLFGVASVILIIVSAICYLSFFYTTKNYYAAMIINRITIFGIVYFGRNKIKGLYQKFSKYWNRHNNPKALKSLTLRNISVIVFNLMFWIINFGMIYAQFLR